MNSEYFNILINLCDKSIEFHDIPIGAIIVLNDKIIGYGYNTRERDTNILGHAEINAILDAQRKINNWNLSGSTMYVTLKPCSMCTEIIRQSRISDVFYLLDKPDNKKEFYKTSFKKIDSCENEEIIEYKLGNFFKNLRNKNIK